MAKAEKCEFLDGESCLSVASNEEAKEVRKISCSNDNEKACCYLCLLHSKCEISCNYLGADTAKTKVLEKPRLTVLSCPLCHSKMLHSDAKLRIGGWSGLWQLVPFGGWGEVGEEVLPVTVYVCPKCGKLEFMAKEKTVQKIISRS